MLRSAKAGFAAIETIASLGLLMVLVVLLQAMEGIRVLQDERSSGLLERERALEAHLPMWMEAREAVMVIAKGKAGWEPFLFPDRHWIPDVRADSLARAGAYVFSKEPARTGNLEGWRLYYRDHATWRPWGQFLVPINPNRETEDTGT